MKNMNLTDQSTKPNNLSVSQLSVSEQWKVVFLAGLYKPLSFIIDHPGTTSKTNCDTIIY